MKKYKTLCSRSVLVTGIPQECNEDEVWNYFSWFGRIDDVKVTKLYSPGNRRFIVKPVEVETTEAILQSTHLIIRNHVLNCFPLKEEQESRLTTMDSVDNNRRVLLKKVPHHICQTDLAMLIEDLSGPISDIFLYEQENTNFYKIKDQNWNLTYVVVFKNSWAAKKLIDIGEIKLKGEKTKIIVERIIFKKDSEDNNNSFVNYNYYSREKRNLTYHDMMYTNQLHNLIQEKKQDSKSFATKRNEVQTKKQSTDIGKYFRLDINAKMHTIKPTSVKYFSYKKRSQAQPDLGLQINLSTRKSSSFPT